MVRVTALRNAQAAHRNAFAQRASKPAHKSLARINKDAATKARRVIKEVSPTVFRVSEKAEGVDAGVLA